MRMSYEALRMAEEKIKDDWSHPGLVTVLSKSPRELLDVHRALQAIAKIEDKLEEMAAPLSDPNAPGVTISAAPNAAAVSALGRVLDSKWKRVSKTVPDLRSVELSGSVGSESTSRDLTPLELVHRVSVARREAARHLLEQHLSEESGLDEDFLE